MTTDEEKIERQTSARAAFNQLADEVLDANAERGEFRRQMADTFSKADDASAMVRALGLPGFARELLIPFWLLVLLIAIADGFFAVIATR